MTVKPYQTCSLLNKKVVLIQFLTVFSPIIVQWTLLCVCKNLTPQQMFCRVTWSLLSWVFPNINLLCTCHTAETRSGVTSCFNHQKSPECSFGFFLLKHYECSFWSSCVCRPCICLHVWAYFDFMCVISMFVGWGPAFRHETGLHMLTAPTPTVDF